MWEVYESDTSVSTLLNDTEASGLGYAASDEAYGDVSLVSSDWYGPSPKCVKVAISVRQKALWQNSYRFC